MPRHLLYWNGRHWHVLMECKANAKWGAPSLWWGPHFTGCLGPSLEGPKFYDTGIVRFSVLVSCHVIKNQLHKGLEIWYGEWLALQLACYTCAWNHYYIRFINCQCDSSSIALGRRVVATLARNMKMKGPIPTSFTLQLWLWCKKKKKMQECGFVYLPGA